jgi:uncharacterized protein YndB with AHSA1/START domain
MTRISIHASVLATIDKAWEYYTETDHITKWNFASDDWFCPSATNQLVVGGKYSARMEAKDGSFGFDFEGMYDDIVIGEKLELTFMDNRKMTVVFSENENTTDIHITFDPESENPIEMQRDGWQMILNNFKKYTENN